ncbi:hypothetical protein Glove_417g28 [Diversispora epigaea]|uniref:Uncharacterized protein n=1 Tax=Diversispora epigaea TaxID=1348612 RepID=A0A397H0K0_9GLOM|nr:hypothetical protein Glove_417g28 [Diversispora epigaea]
MLQKIYPIDYQLQDKEMRAWKAMFKACGCTNVTPFHLNRYHHHLKEAHSTYDCNTSYNPFLVVLAMVMGVVESLVLLDVSLIDDNKDFKVSVVVDGSDCCCGCC